MAWQSSNLKEVHVMSQNYVTACSTAGLEIHLFGGSKLLLVQDQVAKQIIVYIFAPRSYYWVVYCRLSHYKHYTKMH